MRHDSLNRTRGQSLGGWDAIQQRSTIRTRSKKFWGYAWKTREMENLQSIPITHGTESCSRHDLRSGAVVQPGFHLGYS